MRRYRLLVMAGLTAVLIAGVMLLLTGVISVTALVVQLVLYDPPCEPLVAWNFVGACGVLRLLVLMTLPVGLAGLVLLAAGVVLRRRASRNRLLGQQREPRQQPRR